MIFGMNTTSDITKLSQITYNNFEISVIVFMPNITTNNAITYMLIKGGLYDNSNNKLIIFIQGAHLPWVFRGALEIINDKRTKKYMPNHLLKNQKLRKGREKN